MSEATETPNTQTASVKNSIKEIIGEWAAWAFCAVIVVVALLTLGSMVGDSFARSAYRRHEAEREKDELKEKISVLDTAIERLKGSDRYQDQRIQSMQSSISNIVADVYDLKHPTEATKPGPSPPEPREE